MEQCQTIDSPMTSFHRCNFSEGLHCPLLLHMPTFHKRKISCEPDSLFEALVISGKSFGNFVLRSKSQMVVESILPRFNDEVVLMQSTCFHKYVKTKQCIPE